MSAEATLSENVNQVVLWADLPLSYRLKAIAVIGILLGFSGGVAFVANQQSQPEVRIANAFAEIEQSLGQLASAEIAFEDDLRQRAAEHLAGFRRIALSVAPAHCAEIVAIAQEPMDIPAAGDEAFRSTAGAYIARGHEAAEACRDHAR